MVQIQMKKCPYCGQEILAVAKKCKYCRKWIEPTELEKCPYCLELIPKGVDVCPLCNERIHPSDMSSKRDESPLQADTLSEPLPVKEKEDGVSDNTRKKRKKNTIIISSGIASIALCIALVCLISPTNTLIKQSDSSIEDAMQLHEFFFNNLGEPVKSLSDCEALSRRIKELTGKKYDFIEKNLDKCLPVSLSYDDAGHQVFHFSGTRNATSSPETYAVFYTDFNGKCGRFEVSTYIDGKQKSYKESPDVTGDYAEEVYEIREWIYEGIIASDYAIKDIEVTLYVDGPGHLDDAVKAVMHEKGKSNNVPMQGYVRWYASSSMLILNIPEKNDNWYFPLNTVMDENYTSLDLTMALDGFSEGNEESIKLLRTGSGRLSPIKTVSYDGRLYDNKHTYPIEMHLAIDSEDHSEERIMGYYFYKSKGRENFIQLNGKCYHGNSSSSIATLDLHSELDNADFSYETVGDLWMKPSMKGGSWIIHNDGGATKELLFDLAQK